MKYTKRNWAAWAGDVAALKALCEQLQLVEMGLYKER